MVALGRTPYLLLHTVTGERYLPLVGGNCWTVGRSDDNHFVIPDRWISRNHAMLQCTEAGDFYLIDLGARNGSFVNGRRVSVPVILHNSDRLTFGQTELEFYYPNDPSKAEDNKKEDGETLTSTMVVRRLMSVMVVDIRNFTVLSQKIDENILASLIGSWFRDAGNIIRHSGSWVDKYIGDAVMAIWFHRQEEIDKEDVVQIFRAVSDLNKMTNYLNSQYPLPFPLRIGAGINTGYAMVGNYAGRGDRPDYTAIGDTVNAAFRLESATKEIGLDIALGDKTYSHLSDMGIAEQRFQKHIVKLKGFDEETVTYACSFEDLDFFLLDDFRRNITLG